MSFNWYARKVRNPQLTIWRRLSALRSCIRLLTVLTGERFREAIGRFDEQFEFNRYSASHRWVQVDPPDEGQLLKTLAAVEVERNLTLTRLRVFEKKRIRAKMRGRRQLSKVERGTLNEARRLAQSSEKVSFDGEDAPKA